jgi:hypothetical protein
MKSEHLSVLACCAFECTEDKLRSSLTKNEDVKWTETVYDQLHDRFYGDGDRYLVSENCFSS